MAFTLDKHLVLNKYFLHLLGFDSVETFRDEFHDVRDDRDSSGNTAFLNRLLSKKTLLREDDFLHYDEVIREYEDRLRKNRNNPQLTFQYYQYFSILFTEYFLDRLSTDKTKLIAELNAFSEEYCKAQRIEPSAFTEDELRKLAYWMATGSGKTLLMHINYWQILKYFPNWENIILITPNSGLSKQHYDEMKLSGIPCKLYLGSEESLKTKDDEVLIIEITKLTEEKEGGGVSVDVSYFSEKNNLVFIDEGHKGQSSEEQTWKNLRESIGKDGFIFEYSATFGQVISNVQGLLEEYAKAIIFDYSYKYFYTDHYGKDFYVFNLEETEYSELQAELLFTAGLLSYYEQLVLFNKYEKELTPYLIEKPLWVFVGSKVAGKKQSSDVVEVIEFIEKILRSPATLNKNIKSILKGESGLLNAGSDMFEKNFVYLRKNIPDAQEIFEAVFNGTGTLELNEIKNSEGEIGLQTSLGKKYFGVINIGDVPALKKKLLEEKKIEVKDDNIVHSIFQDIDKESSEINILIGAKKFVEGWNSWRVSNMGLMNMGKGEGTQIIQLFGRGVRLKGKNFGLKREENPAYQVKALQTLNIFGLNANYMSAFLTSINKEIEQPEDFEVAIQPNNLANWENKIITVTTDKNYNFKNQFIKLTYKESIAKKISIDLRPKISLAVGLDTGFATDAQDEETYINPLDTFKTFLDWEELYLKLLAAKVPKEQYNLVFDKKVLKQIIEGGKYKVMMLQEQLGATDFRLVNRMQQIAERVLKDYISRFYTESEKDYLTKNLSYEFLSPKKHPELFPKDDKIIVRVPKNLVSQVESVFKDINKFHSEDIKQIPTIHFANHLYSPLASYKKGIQEQIKTIPVKLNKGETFFIDHLRSHIKGHPDKFKNVEVFILRNISKKGIGFFLASTSFYPDFIMWIKKGKSQHILFIDPKGILLTGNFQNEKVVFCNQTIKEIETKLKAKLKADGDKHSIDFTGYIISVTPYDTVKPIFGEGNHKKEDFEKHNILFQETDLSYIVKLFDGKL